MVGEWSECVTETTQVELRRKHFLGDTLDGGKAVGVCDKHKTTQVEPKSRWTGGSPCVKVQLRQPGAYTRPLFKSTIGAVVVTDATQPDSLCRHVHRTDGGGTLKREKNQPIKIDFQPKSLDPSTYQIFPIKIIASKSSYRCSISN